MIKFKYRDLEGVFRCKMLQEQFKTLRAIRRKYFKKEKRNYNIKEKENNRFKEHEI